MTDTPPHPSQIEIPPRDSPAGQLFIVLHGIGAMPASMQPLADALRGAFP